MAKNFLRGVDTKIYFGVMPEELLDPALPLTPPPDVTITTTAAIVAGDVTVAVTALTGPVAAGSAIPFITGVGPTLVTSIVYTIAPAKTGAVALSILPAVTPIASGAVAAHKGLLLLKGGTTSQESIENQGQAISIYQDETGSGFQDGIITTAMWKLTYNFNALPDDLGYYRLKYVALNAIKGVRGYVRKVDPVPPGFATGEELGGLCDLEGWNGDNPADGIVSRNLTFAGRGNPKTAPALRL